MDRQTKFLDTGTIPAKQLWDLRTPTKDRMRVHRPLLDRPVPQQCFVPALLQSAAECFSDFPLAAHAGALPALHPSPAADSHKRRRAMSSTKRSCPFFQPQKEPPPPPSP